MGERARKGGVRRSPSPSAELWPVCCSVTWLHGKRSQLSLIAELANSSVTVISVYVDLPHVGGGGSGGWGAWGDVLL